MEINGTTPHAPELGVPPEVYRFIGVLTRQLHDSLNELGYADQLRGTVDKLPDAKSRLSRGGRKGADPRGAGQVPA